MTVLNYARIGVVMLFTMTNAEITNAGQGWYLMLPPISGCCDALNPNDKGQDEWKVMSDAPLSDWVVSDSFDTARECRRSRDEQLNTQSKIMAEVKTRKPKFLQAVFGQTMSAQCVATDDPRMKK
jgi:hypothetical protein